MSVLEACNSLGIEISPNATLEDVIDQLTARSDDLKIKLLLGIALQEANRDQDAYNVFAEAAELGSVSGMYQQAAYLYDGRGVEQDAHRAIELMELVINDAAAENQGELEQNALLNLGRAHWDTFPHNSEKAEKYWLRAAKDGNGMVEAMTELGKFYAHAENNDPKQSFYWHQNAAGKGSSYSQTVIGIMYFRGQGIPQSTTKALECLKEAAAGGSIYARANLAELYYKRKLFTEAVGHAKKVCELHKEEGPFTDADSNRGLTIAAFLLARCMQLGRGTSVDPDTSQILFKLAASTDAIVACKLHNEMIHGTI